MFVFESFIVFLLAWSSPFYYMVAIRLNAKEIHSLPPSEKIVRMEVCLNVLITNIQTLRLEIFDRHFRNSSRK